MKILSVSQDGNRFVLKVRLNDGQKELHSYERSEHAGLVSYSMTNREDA